MAEEVCLYLYKDGESGEAYGSFPMEKGEKGTWRWETEENLNGVYYDFRLSMDGEQVWSWRSLCQSLRCERQKKFGGIAWEAQTQKAGRKIRLLQKQRKILFMRFM